MLELILEGQTLPLSTEDGDYGVTRRLTGVNTLEATLPVREPAAQLLREEGLVRDTWENRLYRIKGIEIQGDWAEFSARLRLDDWENTAVTYFSLQNASISTAMEKILPLGWQAEYGALNENLENITMEYGGTPLDIALKIQEVYGCAMDFSPEERIVTITYPHAGVLTDTVLTQGADLREIPNYTGKSTELCTRIYPVGAGGLTIEAVSDGKAYVENHSYTDRVIARVWKDERYEIPEHLRDAAQAMVDQLSMPETAWELRIHDLYRRNPEKWQGHRAVLGEKVTVSWAGRKISALVAEETVHPGHPEQNTLCIGSVPPSTIGALGQLEQEIRNPNSSFNAEKAAAIENATKLISGSRGGHVVTVLDGDGKPQEICILTDTEDISTAKSLWRWNEGGLGHSDSGYNGPFTLALTKDGAIVADRITAGTLNAGIVKAGILSDGQNRNYWNLETGEFRLASTATVGGSTVSEIASGAANTAADSALSTAKGYADGKLSEAKDYASSAASSAAAAAMAEYDSILDQQKVFQKLTGGQTQGIYLTDGRLYINGSYIKTGVLDAGSITMSGRLFTRNGSSDENSGYIGYMEGSTGTAVTKGIGVSNRAGDCFAIATEAGVRLQAGEYSMFVTKTGTAAIRSGAGTLSIETEGPMGPGLYYSGSIFTKNSQGAWYQVT